MEARWMVALVVVVLLSAATAQANESGQAVDRHTGTTAIEAASTVEQGPPPSAMGASSFSSAVHERIEPVISDSMRDTVVEKLRVAFDVAADRVRESPECRELFSELGVDGVEMLSTTLYYPAHPLNEASECRRGVVAFTTLGGSLTWVCRRFSRLTVNHAAKTIVHEALHHAGLPEFPLDPDAMMAREIDAMVSSACGF